jgi:hypothetical protein
MAGISAAALAARGNRAGFHELGVLLMGLSAAPTGSAQLGMGNAHAVPAQQCHQPAGECSVYGGHHLGVEKSSRGIVEPTNSLPRDPRAAWLLGKLVGAYQWTPLVGVTACIRITSMPRSLAVPQFPGHLGRTAREAVSPALENPSSFK